MAITLDGTTGISSVDGSAASPSVRGSDSNSGILYSADAIKFSTGGTQRAIIDNNGLSASGHVIQLVEATGNTATSSTSTSYIETVITGAITPLKSDSVILVDVATSIWPPAGTYVHAQLRSSGGNTNNDIGTWGDNYTGVSDVSFSIWLPYRHTSHNTTSAITYKIFGRKQSSAGSTWYLPNDNTGNSTMSWMIRMTEVAA